MLPPHGHPQDEKVFFGLSTTRLEARAEGAKLSYEGRGRGGTEGISYISW